MSPAMVLALRSRSSSRGSSLRRTTPWGPPTSSTPHWLATRPSRTRCGRASRAAPQAPSSTSSQARARRGRARCISSHGPSRLTTRASLAGLSPRCASPTTAHAARAAQARRSSETWRPRDLAATLSPRTPTSAGRGTSSASSGGPCRRPWRSCERAAAAATCFLLHLVFQGAVWSPARFPGGRAVIARGSLAWILLRLKRCARSGAIFSCTFSLRTLFPWCPCLVAWGNSATVGLRAFR
mmetsp:Transcript_66552/g.183847  ORF Transcript_66552/g.183847 Transcript_66552/m.183847 type:complete len:240 (-) Transcript_66552:19-738(-)